MPPPYEMVELRRPNAVLPLTRWKVTARYSVQISATEMLSCVRVRGAQLVLHFSLTEFNRLFKPEKS